MAASGRAPMTGAARQDRLRATEMSCLPPHQNCKTVAVIGGGFTGSLFALKLAAARPSWTIILIERDGRAGRGVAYGACGPQHILNVPVARMEVGLNPRFADWIRLRPAHLAEALAENGGNLDASFVPRRLFGDYLEEQVLRAMQLGRQGGIRRVHGEAMKITATPRLVVLDDGRVLDVDIVVLATGQEAAVFPLPVKTGPNVIADPWSPGVLDAISPRQTVLLLGSGLTAVDTILSLRARGHVGTIHIVSRHGLLPHRHHSGGSWGPVLQPGVSPKDALRNVRAHVRKAEAQGVPWQRVFDAIRPAVAAIWNSWTIAQQSQFLRHLRAIWDVHRHRMAGRIAAVIDELVLKENVIVTAGKILSRNNRESQIVVTLRRRRGMTKILDVDAIVNCTGPHASVRHFTHPLLDFLLYQGLAHPDPLGLGLESEDCAVRTADGVLSDWLYALGPLTRAAWWEIIAVPEIKAQVDRLVQKITNDETATLLLSATFMDIGAGI